MSEVIRKAAEDISIVNDYTRTYFTGAQAEIWIGNTFLAESTEVNYSYPAEKVPLYSYASTHFVAMATGRVIVTGSIMINFIEKGYLFKALNNYKNEQKNFSDKLNSSLTGTEETSEVKAIKERAENLSNIVIPGQGITAETIQAYRDLYWAEEKAFNYLTAPQRPEFIIPFNLKIKDYPIGQEKPIAREIINCYLNQEASVRRIDGSPVVEVYTFIGQTII